MHRPINAKAETLETSRMFRAAFTRRRCAVVVDGFYEWKPIEGAKRKQPLSITRNDGRPFVLAGLWERWRPKDAQADDP